MKEQKFRAWDKITKKYYVVSTLEYADNGELCEVWLADILVTEPNDACRNPKDVILEQGTGFEDKNGKEICEGDIIVDFDGFISVVDGNCAVISEKTCRKKHFDEDDYSLERRTRPLIRVVNDYGYYPEKKETQVEVIGNIHENADLLEDGDNCRVQISIELCNKEKE